MAGRDPGVVQARRPHLLTDGTGVAPDTSTVASSRPPGPTGWHRVLQLHPTRRCNLRCLHCYSASGPSVREELSESLLRTALDDAASEGFTLASFSGGEPLLYPGLARVLEHARALGMTTTVTSNGITLTDSRLGWLAGRADLIAISLDGVPASHDRMRGSRGAFARMAARLPAVRRSGIPFGFIFTLTRHNLNELDWVTSFAEAQGARLLQIHPLEEVGRAATELRGARPDQVEAGFAVIELVRLQKRLAGRLRIHLDLADVRALVAEPALGFGGAGASDCAQRRLADLISPVIVETDGFVSPLQYGFDRRFGLGSLHEAPLSKLGRSWRESVLPSFRRLCHQVHADLTSERAPRFVNWYEAIGRAAAGFDFGSISDQELAGAVT